VAAFRIARKPATCLCEPVPRALDFAALSDGNARGSVLLPSWARLESLLRAGNERSLLIDIDHGKPEVIVGVLPQAQPFWEL